MHDYSISSTAVDLSRLPAPVVVEQLSYEAILADLIAAMQARLPSFDATVESDPVIKLLEVCAYRELIVRQKVNDGARSVMLAYATGPDLENLAALVGVGRLVITPADPARNVAQVVEDDDALRARVVLAPESFSVAGPELAYVFHARSAHPDIRDATAVSPVPGEVLVTILSRSGNGVAADEVIAAVDAIVDSRTVRPLTDLVTVQSAEIVDYAIEAMLYLYDGPDAAIVIAAAEASVLAYIDENHLLARDISLSGVYAALHVAGVQRVDLVSPAANIVIDATQAGFCTGVTLTYAGQGN